MIFEGHEVNFILFVKVYVTNRGNKVFENESRVESQEKIKQISNKFCEVISIGIAG